MDDLTCLVRELRQMLQSSSSCRMLIPLCTKLHGVTFQQTAVIFPSQFSNLFVFYAWKLKGIVSSQWALQWSLFAADCSRTVTSGDWSSQWPQVWEGGAAATIDIFRYEWGTTEWGTLYIVVEEHDTHTHKHTHTHVCVCVCVCIYVYIYIYIYIITGMSHSFQNVLRKDCFVTLQKLTCTSWQSDADKKCALSTDILLAVCICTFSRRFGSYTSPFSEIRHILYLSVLYELSADGRT
jgi:hypothetical protein